MHRDKFDIIIIGAGVSGLILANEILDRTDKSVLLLEKKKKIKFDKNLCFWNIPNSAITNFADNEWKSISIIINGKKKLHESCNIKYLRIKSENLFNFYLQRLKKRKNFKLLTGQDIRSLEINPHTVYANTKTNKFQSSILFDSRIEKGIKSSNKLMQHFYGVEIKFESECVNKNEMILMDIQDNGKEFNFIYSLPFSKSNVLIETTYFSKKTFSISKYKKDLKSYISKNYSGRKYKVLFKEFGIIPMFKFEEKDTDNYIKIGTAGNWIRQSTGYSLQNSFFFSKQIVDCIIKGKKPKVKKKIFYNFLDQTFCNLAINNPTKLKLFFDCFFRNNKLKTIVKFLTYTANMREIIKIILSLPKLLLVKTVLEIK